MHYNPSIDPRPLPFDPFKSCTVPRPIGWLSTISKDGHVNLAPYSQWQNLTFDPPMVMFAANVRSDGRRKDTVVNAEDTGWFVWNMAIHALREAVNISAMELPPQEDEFLAAGGHQDRMHRRARPAPWPKARAISNAHMSRRTACPAATRAL